MKTIKFFTYAVVVLFLGLASCSTDGEDGMDGMDGAPGAQGVAGEDGADGQNGEDGNANVASVTFNAYSIVIGNNEFSIPEITQDIYDNGLVMGYVTVNGNDFWETMPIVSSGSVILDVDRIYLGGLRVVSTFNQTVNFRFVIIEGSPAGRAAQESGEDLKSFYESQGVDFSDFEAVSAYFNLDK